MWGFGTKEGKVKLVKLKAMITFIKNKLRSLFNKKTSAPTIIVVNINGKTDVTYKNK